MSDTDRTRFVQEADQELGTAFAHIAHAGCCLLEAAQGPQDYALADQFMDALTKVYAQIEQAEIELELFAKSSESAGPDQAAPVVVRSVLGPSAPSGR